MRINQNSSTGVRIDSRHGVDSARGTGSGSQPAAVTPAEAGDSASAPELARLVDAVHATEEIRPGLIDEVSRRLAAGAYETRESAERTAGAILSFGD